MKICKICGQEKELKDFNRKGYLKNGDIRYDNTCKECRHEKRNVHYQENKERISTERKKHYQENLEEMREKGRVFGKKYYHDNKELLAEKQVENNAKGKEKYHGLIHSMFDSKNDKKSDRITYVVHSNEFCKIGCTTNLYHRLTALKTHIGVVKLYVLNKDVEKRLLKEFKEYRFKHDIKFCGYSECFNFSNDVLEFLINREGFKEFII